MTKKILCVVPLVMLLGSALYAQDIVGEWQGTVCGQGSRIVLQIAKGDSGGWSGKFYSIDFGPDSITHQFRNAARIKTHICCRGDRWHL